MKKIGFVLICSVFLLALSNPFTFVKAETDILETFVNALMKKDERFMKSCLTELAELPDISFQTELSKVKRVRTPQKDTEVLIAFSKDNYKNNKISFIWEVTTKGTKISNVKKIYDGMNPLIEEAKIVKEYEMKFKNNVLVPTQFPFKVNEFNGFIHNKYLELLYYNDTEQVILKITIAPIDIKLEEYKQKHDKFYVLKDGTKVLYREFDLAYELRFQKQGINYTVSIGNKKSLKKNILLMI
ncbi:hypothetical protein IQ781_27435 (plasmid) [Bacillus sp. N447-1]|uniref:hypothetical protein n=1 Tax=Bacillus sp. N447-1 TaxID=2789208 RepID=UPI001F5FFF3F|nr:hypothetical protein [Bacillus sp. N447-1]UNT71716.1 hypothetical protein IQ781_27435 [Bacillus sp. N447-1]